MTRVQLGTGSLQVRAAVPCTSMGCLALGEVTSGVTAAAAIRTGHAALGPCLVGGMHALRGHWGLRADRVWRWGRLRRCAGRQPDRVPDARARWGLTVAAGVAARRRAGRQTDRGRDAHVHHGPKLAMEWLRADALIDNLTVFEMLAHILD